ncbi:phosphatidylserine decarboxylase 1 [Rhizina undulata]
MPVSPSSRICVSSLSSRSLLSRRSPLHTAKIKNPIFTNVRRRYFSAQKNSHQQQQQHNYGGREGDGGPSFFRRLGAALRNTRVEWYNIPVVLGIGVVGFVSYRKNARAREEARRLQEEKDGVWQQGERRIRPMGPWQVQVLSTLPLKALSYYWGRFNEIPLPVFLRVPGFKLYSWVFGVNLDEVENDLKSYRNLAEFFYRRLKPGCRPIDPRIEVMVSPADGKVLQFGEVRAGGEVEQVKGMTYSLDALLGAQTSLGKVHREGVLHSLSALAKKNLEGVDGDKDAAVYQSDEEFANVNGISYTLPSLLSGEKDASEQSKHPKTTREDDETSDDVSVPPSNGEVAEVRADLARGSTSSWWGSVEKPKRLFFCVIYLAPGDYHRFHSPVNWVVERRRHFAGELYSVSPYLQNRLPGLFTLNERVVLLGRWKYGMFSMTPVGATNVGSIKIHFDRELRTNSLTHDATKAGSEGGFAEATYRNASPLLGGQPVVKGAEMGGFNLGSTIVLVFEAPGSSGKENEPGKGGFRFLVKRGQKVKVGEAIGIVEE